MHLCLDADWILLQYEILEGHTQLTHLHFMLPPFCRLSFCLWGSTHIMIELQCAGFVTTTDACCGLGKYGGLFYSCVFFHGWRAATHRAMSGAIHLTNSTFLLRVCSQKSCSGIWYVYINLLFTLLQWDSDMIQSTFLYLLMACTVKKSPADGSCWVELHLAG